MPSGDITRMKYTFTDKILLLLSDFTDTYDHFIGFHYIPPFIKGLPKKHPDRKWMEKYLNHKHKRQKIHSTLANLKRRGFLQKKIFQNSYGFVLSPKAKEKISFLKNKTNKEKLPQGQQLLLFFDIPENKRLSRDTFRQSLKNLGFEQLQRSAWITSYNVVQNVKEIIKEKNLNDYVQILIVKNTKLP